MSRNGTEILAFFIGAAFTLLLSKVLSPGVGPALHIEAMTAAERESGEVLVGEVRPMEVRITFLDRADYDKTIGDVKSSGWTDWWSHPYCAITVATDGGHLFGVPKEGRVYDSAMTNTIGHELMHCLRGAWHPGWDEIEADRAKAAAEKGP